MAASYGHPYYVRFGPDKIGVQSTPFPYDLLKMVKSNLWPNGQKTKHFLAEVPCAIWACVKLWLGFSSSVRVYMSLTAPSKICATRQFARRPPM